MGREIRMVLSGETHAHVMLRSRLAVLLLATLALDAVGTVLMYLFEHDEPGSGFHSIGGALFWVSAQLTTVSSQMPNPLTTRGTDPRHRARGVGHLRGGHAGRIPRGVLPRTARGGRARRRPRPPAP